MNQANFRLLALLILLIPRSHLFAQGVNQYFWVPNGPVHAIQPSDSGVFIGGDFDDIGPCTGHLVFLDSLTGLVLPNSPKITGTILASTTDGKGGRYIGGEFQYGNIINLAHIDSLGLVDTVWTPNPNGPVYSLDYEYEGTLTVRNNRVYVGGEFTFIGGIVAQNLAVVDTLNGTGDPLFIPQPNGPVFALELNKPSNTLYLGGDFTTVYGIQRNNLARVDLITGSLFQLPLLPSLDLYYPCNGPVKTLKFRNDTLFVGGEFTFVSNIARSRFVAFNTSTPACVMLPLSFAFNGAVYAIELQKTKLYCGGSFSSIAQTSKGRLCSYDLITQTMDPWDPALSGTVYALDADSTVLYVGGSFPRSGTTDRKRIASFDIASGSLLPWDPHMGGTVYTIHKDTSNVLAGGAFFTVGGVERNFLAEIDISTGRPSSFAPQVTGSVFTLFKKDSLLFLGGTFDNVSGQSRKKLAGINLNTNALLALNISFSGTVRSIHGEGSNLFAGGYFDTVSGQARNNIAAIDLITETLLGWNPNANGTVNSILADGNNVYLGGYFTNVNGFSRSRIACIELSTGYPLTTWNPSFDDGIYSLSRFNNKIIAGGFFNQVNGISRNNLAIVDINTGQLDPYNPNPDNYVRSTFVKGDTLLVGGMFDVFNTQMKYGYSQVNLSTNASNNLSFPCESSVNAVSFAHGIYFSGGAFKMSDGIFHPHFAVYYPANLVSIPSSESEDTELKIYPNPTNGPFTIEGKEISECKVLDVSGKHLPITDKDLSPGVYILEFRMKDGRTISRKLVVTGR